MSAATAAGPTGLVRRRWTLAVALGATVVLARAAMVGWTAGSTWAAPVPLALDALVPLAAALLMAHASWRLRVRSPSEARAWRALAGAWGCYGAAEAMWSFFGATFDTPPSSYVTFTLYLLFYPLFLLGILRLPALSRTRTERVALLLDMSTVLAGTALILFALLVRPALDLGSRQPLRLAMTMAAPAGDLAVLWALLVLLQRHRERGLPAGYVLLAGSAACMIVADGLWAYHLLFPSPRLWRLLPPGWTLAHALAALAAARQLIGLDPVVADGAAPEAPRRRSRASLFLAYGCLAAAAVVLAGGSGSLLDVLALVAILGVLGLVLLRKLVDMAESERLRCELFRARDTLEEEVNERTRDLARTDRALAAEIDERRRAEDRILTEVHRLAALRSIDRAISGSYDLHVTLDVFLEKATSRLGVDAAAVLLLDAASGTLSVHARRGFRAHRLEEERLPPGEGHAGLAARERRVVRVADLSSDPDAPSRGRTHAAEGFRSLCAAPLVTHDQVLGVLEVYSRGALGGDEGWLEFLGTLAGQGAIAVDNAALFERIQRSNLDLVRAYDSTLRGWALALELRGHEPPGHSQRVTAAAVRLARAFDVEQDELVQVRRGALLHDIGKIALPDSILLKTGPLTDEEWTAMRRHPVHAFELLSQVDYLRPALDIPYCHHERWDGTGYPRGLLGRGIPLAARLFSVVDAWDALSFARPYREPWPPDRVRRHIEATAGTLFDPDAVRVFFEVSRPEGMTT